MFKINLKVIHCCLSIAILTGCAHGIRPLDFMSRNDRVETRDSPNCATVDKPEEKVKLQLIRQFMETGKLHAALAHLDATGLKSPRETYLRADILRRTGRSEQAVPYYKKLIHGCTAGNAYHGLGLIAGRGGHIDEALRYLNEARRKLPTDVQVRNDLGYALLLDRQYEAARYEFLTALELDETDEFSASNLVLLLLTTEQPKKAQSLAVRMKISGESFKELVARAQHLKISSPSAGEPEQAKTTEDSETNILVETAEKPSSAPSAEKIESTATSDNVELAQMKTEESMPMAQGGRAESPDSNQSPDTRKENNP